MKMAFMNIFALAIFAATSSAASYQLIQSPGGGGCTKDGTTCNVYCDNGKLAGSMNWNGSVWTDGAKWDPDKDTEALKIVAANGTSCK